MVNLLEVESVEMGFGRILWPSQLTGSRFELVEPSRIGELSTAPLGREDIATGGGLLDNSHV